MLIRKTIALQLQEFMKHTDTLCAQNTEHVSFTVSGAKAYSYRIMECVLKKT
jgi:hypothetical protein